MTVLYPLQNQQNYDELLYSLRSLEKFLPGDYEVIIVGDKLPPWITGVTQINLPDIKGRKQLTIKSKIIAGLNYVDQVFFMNDDVFLLQETDPDTHPYYFYGSLKYYNESGTRPLQTRLEEYGKEIKNFDLHYPLVYRKDFIDVAAQFQQDTIVKSMYCNYLGIDGTESYDCKLIKQEQEQTIFNYIKTRPAFSTGIYSVKAAMPVLRKLFPDPSKYEI